MAMAIAIRKLPHVLNQKTVRNLSDDFMFWAFFVILRIYLIRKSYEPVKPLHDFFLVQLFPLSSTYILVISVISLNGYGGLFHNRPEHQVLWCKEITSKISINWLARLYERENETEYFTIKKPRRKSERSETFLYLQSHYFP